MKSFAAFLLAGLSFPLLAGDWMLSEGEQSLYASLSFSRAQSYWDDSRTLQQDDCTSFDRSLKLHYEHGWSYYHTLFASTSFDMERCGEEGSTGMPDLKLGVRGRVNPFRNSHSWELALTLPVNGDRFDRRKPGNGLIGLEAGLYRTYRDDPYESPFTVITRGLWGWGVGLTLWSEGAGQELWGELHWSKRLNEQWRFKSWVDGHYSVAGISNAADDLFSSRRTVDYDRLSIGGRFSRKLSPDTGTGLALVQTLWGRNTARDTTLRLEFHRNWD